MVFMMPPMDLYSQQGQPKKKKRNGSQLAPETNGTALAPEGSMADEEPMTAPGHAPMRRKRRRMPGGY